MPLIFDLPVRSSSARASRSPPFAGRRNEIYSSEVTAIGASPTAVNVANQNARSASANWVGPEIRLPGRSWVASWGQRATANPAPVSMQRWPAACADGNSRAKNWLTASGVGMSMATPDHIAAGPRSEVEAQPEPGERDRIASVGQHVEVEVERDVLAADQLDAGSDQRDVRRIITARTVVALAIE